jgi:hypothetical protein
MRGLKRSGLFALTGELEKVVEIAEGLLESAIKMLHGTESLLQVLRNLGPESSRTEPPGKQAPCLLRQSST